MFTTTRARDFLIATATVSLVCLVAFPVMVFAASSKGTNPLFENRELIARGIARRTINGENVTLPANFTLMLLKAEPNGTIPRFSVTAGTININGTEYTVTSGTGAVLLGRHTALLEAYGTDAVGNVVTFRLAGRYFWMGGRIFILRIAGALQTDNGRIVLLMRAAIKI